MNLFKFHIFKLYIKLIFLGKYLCIGYCEFEHDRLVNVQNPIKITQNSSGPEPNACRKQALLRHFKELHPKCEMKTELKMKRKTDGQKLNDLVAISQATKALPTFCIAPNDVLLMDELCEYSLRHGVNPIRNGTVNLDKRSIVKKSCSQHDNFKKNIIKKLKEVFDAELKDSVTLTDKNGRSAFGGNTKSLIIPTLEVDHAKVSKKNYFSINLTLKKIELDSDQTNPTNSLPIELKEIPARNGKTMKCNVKNIRNFLEENFENKDHWRFFSVTGDAALISTKIIQHFKNEENLEHLHYCAFICTNHLDPLVYKHTIYKLLDDSNMDCNTKLFPGRKKKNQGNKVFFWGSEKEEFVTNFKLFIEYLDICTEIDPTSNLKFEDQLIAIQKKFILNEVEKIGELENEHELKNPYSCDLVSQYDRQFFNQQCEPRRQRIHRVPPSSDMKQRRLPHQWEEMLGCSEYAHMLIEANQRLTTKLKTKLKINELKVLDMGMKHKLAKFVSMLKYTKSLADSRNENENFTLMRAINLSVKVACEDSFENEFIW